MEYNKSHHLTTQGAFASQPSQIKHRKLQAQNLLEQVLEWSYAQFSFLENEMSKQFG